jgi:hypothetical protein
MHDLLAGLDNLEIGAGEELWGLSSFLLLHSGTRGRKCFTGLYGRANAAW